MAIVNRVYNGGYRELAQVDGSTNETSERGESFERGSFITPLETIRVLYSTSNVRC